MPKSIVIKCPCCRMLLDVDVASRKVIRHFKKGDHGKVDAAIFDQGLKKVTDREEKADDRFSAALSSVEERADSLEAKMEEARRKALEEKEGDSM